MRIHYLSIIAILFISLALYSCVDEPTVSEVKRPYSSVRLGNFSDNVAKINVSIDGATNYSVAQYELSDRFDLDSGQRNVVVTNDNGDTLYNSRVTMSSYEEITLLFTGYSAPGDDFNNTFADYSYSEGVVYIQNGPDADTSAWVHMFDVISDTPTDISRTFTAKAISNLEEDDPDDPGVELSFNTVQSVEVPAGDTKFVFLIEIGDRQANKVYDTLGVYDANLEGGVRHYLFLTGITDTMGVTAVRKVQVPLPDRSK